MINKLKNLTIKSLSSLIYFSYIVWVYLVLTEGTPIYETIFRLWIITYITVIFNLFFDKNPPRYFNLNKWLDKNNVDDYCWEYVENVLDILRVTMRYIRIMKREKNEEELEKNMRIVQTIYRRLQKMDVPPKYESIQRSVIKEVESFLGDYNSSDTQNRTSLCGDEMEDTYDI